MAAIGKRVIRDFMPDQHRLLFGQLPFVRVGSVDALGRPWASVLVGEPGFLRWPDLRRLDTGARPIEGDPLADGLRELGVRDERIHAKAFGPASTTSRSSRRSRGSSASRPACHTLRGGL